MKQNGLRVTMPRVQVLRALDESDRALSAYDIHGRILNGGGRIDVVSVYRILSTLVELGLAHHIGIVDGYIACRMQHEHQDQTEHIVCQKCGQVQEVAVPEEALHAAQTQLQFLGFSPSNIKVEILGNCQACQNRA